MLSFIILKDSQNNFKKCPAPLLLLQNMMNLFVILVSFKKYILIADVGAFFFF